MTWFNGSLFLRVYLRNSKLKLIHHLLSISPTFSSQPLAQNPRSQSLNSPIMVRLKDRYLLVNILYTDLPPSQPSSSSSSSSSPNTPVSDLLRYNQPTTTASASADLKPQTLLRDIRNEITSLFGDCGAGKVNHNLQVKYFSPATSTFILRVSREHYRLVWAALSFMQSFPVKNGRPCIYRVLRVSGTMRKVEKETIRRARLLILAAKEELKGRSSSDSLGALLRGDSTSQQRTLPIVGGQDVDSASEDDMVED
ncbi:Rpp14/Pop5 family-domain-containing protein [Cercophora samala]|uniref:Ribonuclease P/MRP protein subunit POP5 n=1 Tax=Cercophora samala TaxID=330535 RepID=A0AA40DDL6_9PEZI|nr:Rpp14/Pop5 family-domain-containing protein [Cercophora samala]